jgi:hypothetical protein
LVLITVMSCLCWQLQCRVLCEKLIAAQLVKKFPAFYGTWMFITVFTRLIIPSTRRTSECSLPFRISKQKSYMPFSSPHMCYMPHPSHPTEVCDPKNICRRVQIMKFLIIGYNVLQPPVTSSLLFPNILLSTLFSNKSFGVDVHLLDCKDMWACK